MKTAFFYKGLGLITLLLFACLGCTKTTPYPKVRVLTYSSLGGKGGFLESIREPLKTTRGCELEIETTLGAPQVLTYVEEESIRKRIDLVVGVDELLFERMKPYVYSGDLTSLRLAERLHPIIAARFKNGFIPLDFGAMSFIYRKAARPVGALNLKEKFYEKKDLLTSEFKKKWIVQDPRSSSPGLMFFLWMDSVIPLKELRRSWYTLTPSWESSYKMFLAGEGSAVWSYLTSLAYHEERGERGLYDVLRFKEGYPLQVEGMMILNQPGNPRHANPCIDSFIEQVYQKESQALLAKKQWMLPAVKEVPLPESFKVLPEIKEAVGVNFNLETVDRLISTFGKEVRDE